MFLVAANEIGKTISWNYHQCIHQCIVSVFIGIPLQVIWAMVRSPMEPFQKMKFILCQAFY